MNTVQIDPSLALLLQDEPFQRHRLLVRVQQADDDTAQKLDSLGLEVLYRYRLVPSFAVVGPGESALKLLDCTWVCGIEADQPVHTTTTSM